MLNCRTDPAWSCQVLSGQAQTCFISLFQPSLPSPSLHWLAEKLSVSVFNSPATLYFNWCQEQTTLTGEIKPSSPPPLSVNCHISFYWPPQDTVMMFCVKMWQICWLCGCGGVGVVTSNNLRALEAQSDADTGREETSEIILPVMLWFGSSCSLLYKVTGRGKFSVSAWLLPRKIKWPVP